METRHWAVILLALTIAAGGAWAEEAGSYTGSLWAFLDSKQALEAAAGISPSAYPDSDAAVVDERILRVYRADGRGEFQDESYAKVLTEKGKRRERTIALSFMLPYSRVEVLRLEIFKPGGAVVPVDVAANSKETIDDSQMASNIYDPNLRLLRVNIPQLEVGDVIHAITRVTTDRPIMPGQMADESLFEGDGYIRHLVYEIHAPEGRPLLRTALRDEIPGKVEYSRRPDSEGGLIHRWEVADVPRIFEEPSQPPYDEVLQRLHVSTATSWREVSAWYWNLSLPHLNAVDDQMEAEVRALTAGAGSEDEKIKALFYYVSKSIRYLGLTPEKDRPGFEPHDVKTTFEKKYGVCRDKAGLLVEMLRLAGLEAYPVLLNLGAKRDAQVPDTFFDHAIVAVQSPQGGYELMDPTDENTRELLPYYDDDRSYLVCRPEGEDLKLSPVQSPEANMMRIRTTGTLAASGDLDATSTLSFEGLNDDAYRNAFARMKPDDERRFFETRLRQAIPGARVKSLALTPANMLDMSSGLEAVLEFSASGLTASGGGTSVLSVPWIGRAFGVVNFLLDGAGLEKRKYPMETRAACGLEEEVSLKLDSGFAGTVSLPSCPPVDDETLSYRQTYAAHDGSLDCSRAFELKGVEFSPAQYLNLKRTLKSMEYDGRKAPLLALAAGASTPAPPEPEVAKAPPVDSNAQILYSRAKLDAVDGHNWLFKVDYSKRILTYEGKVREAEIKLNYNPACEDVELTRGVVVSKGGARQEISADEINIMDEGWNASAKRYTGGKVLVANLPGVDIGSTIEVAFQIRVHDRPFLAGFESFQGPNRVDHKTFELDAPADLKVSERVEGPPGLIAETDRSGEGRRSYSWRADDVGALPTEGDLPPLWVYGSGVNYFAGDLGAELRDLSDAMVLRASRGKEAARKAAELIGPSTTRLEAVEAIRDFVASSIRPAGPSFADLPLSELSDADRTLTDGYGHAADRAILLYAMLGAAGFDPDFVLASRLPPIAAIDEVLQSSPMPEEFERPLVRVAVDGQAYYLNDSDQYARLGSTSSEGCLGLDLATQAREVIRAAPGCESREERDYTLSISDDGSARLGVATRYYGESYDRKRRYFAELPPEERQRYFQEIVSRLAQGARPEGGLTSDFASYPGLEQYTVDLDNYAVADGKYLCFDLPFAPSLLDAGGDRRTLPYFISRRGDRTIRVSVDLPPGFRHPIIAPQAAELELPDGGGRALVVDRARTGGFELSYELDSEPAIIGPEDYAALLGVESALGRKSSRTFLVEGD
jgi:transglutaminase-like putative cysteine protease